MQDKREKRFRRHKRVRSQIKGTASVPRLCVFRSNKHIYAQLIDNEKGATLISTSDFDIKPQIKASQPKSEKIKKEITGKVLIAYKVGQFLAKKALSVPEGQVGKTKKKFEKIVFDRGGYKYHGRVKALAEGARKEGLKF